MCKKKIKYLFLFIVKSQQNNGKKGQSKDLLILPFFDVSTDEKKYYLLVSFLPFFQDGTSLINWFFLKPIHEELIRSVVFSA